MNMAEDAIKVASHVYKIVLENDKVRVLESVMKPGDKTAMHGHPAVVAVPIKGGRFKFTTSDGETMEADVQDGVPMYFDATEHEVENVGDSEGRVFLIELKK